MNSSFSSPPFMTEQYRDDVNASSPTSSTILSPRGHQDETLRSSLPGQRLRQRSHPELTGYRYAPAPPHAADVQPFHPPYMSMVPVDNSLRRARSNTISGSLFPMPHSSPSGQASFLSCNIYIRGLAPSMTDKALDTICREFGTVISAKAIIDPQTQLCKGFGFVLFAEEASAQRAIESLWIQGYQTSYARVGPREVTDDMAEKIRRLQDNDTTNVYISNLPYEMSEDELLHLFRNYKVESCKILYENGQSRGVGFVRLDTRDAALAVIDEFHGYVIPGTCHHLQARFADSDAVKKIKTHVTKKKSPRKGVRHGEASEFMFRHAALPATMQYAPFFTGPPAAQVLPVMTHTFLPDVTAGIPVYHSATMMGSVPIMGYSYYPAFSEKANEAYEPTLNAVPEGSSPYPSKSTSNEVPELQMNKLNKHLSNLQLQTSGEVTRSHESPLYTPVTPISSRSQSLDVN